jgi:hypothetical protein
VGDFLLDLALPSSDRAVLVQLVVAVPIFAWWIWRVRANKDQYLLAGGVAVFTFAWFALGTVH